MSIKKFFTGKNANSLEEALQKIKLPKNSRVVTMQQTHGNMIADLSENLENVHQKIQQITDVDACFTNQKNVYLTVRTADCLPILISGEYQDSKGIIQEFVAVAHAGRKGTNAQILNKLLSSLEKKFLFLADFKKHDSHKLSIWFGPAICPEGYQIDRDTNTHFDLVYENKKQIANFFDSHGLDFTKHVNLVIDLGCTLHEPKKYYSYRASGPGVKMNYSFIVIT